MSNEKFQKYHREYNRSAEGAIRSGIAGAKSISVFNVFTDFLMRRRREG